MTTPRQTDTNKRRQTKDIVADLRTRAEVNDINASVMREAADRLEASSYKITAVHTLLDNAGVADIHHVGERVKALVAERDTARGLIAKLREALIAELTERREHAEHYAKEAHNGGYLWRASPWAFSPEDWADAVLERLNAPTFRPADKPIPPEVYHNKPGNGGIFTAETMAAAITARTPKGIAVQIGDEVLCFEVREAYYNVSRKEGVEPFEISYESQSEAVVMFERLIGAAYLRARVPAWVRFNGVRP